jgi:hypothetical protein
MSARRRPAVPETTRKLTPEECTEWLERTGRIHRDSRWHGLLTGYRCSADDVPCDGSCGREPGMQTKDGASREIATTMRNSTS